MHQHRTIGSLIQPAPSGSTSTPLPVRVVTAAEGEGRHRSSSLARSVATATAAAAAMEPVRAGNAGAASTPPTTVNTHAKFISLTWYSPTQVRYDNYISIAFSRLYPFCSSSLQTPREV
jgi:hypothetical protein